MPLYLKAKAIGFGDIFLANNDIVLTVRTPESMLKPKVYRLGKDDHLMKRDQLEFERRTETDWEAFIYFLPKDMQNDRAFIASAESDFHVHMFATLFFAGGLRIDSLLPKSAHNKNDRRPNLADEPLAQWDRLVADMSSRTQIAVERFRIHYVERYLDPSHSA
jgi:hypothetical protein